MDLETYNKTVTRLKTDKFFAVSFTVDNNPTAIIENLKSLGYSSQFKNNLAADKLTAKKIIFELISRKNAQALGKIFDNANYLDNDSSSSEYTKGYRAYFLENTSPQGLTTEIYANKSGFSFDGLLAGLGAGLLTYGTLAGSGAGTPQAEADAQAQAKAEQAAKTKKMWVIIGSIVGGVGLLAIVYFLWPKGKKDGK